MRYAQNTSVSVQRSQAEIHRVLERYGADNIGIAQSKAHAKVLVIFNYDGLDLKIELDLPDIQEDRFRLTETGKGRRPELIKKCWEQGCRQRWRRLMLSLTARLEEVEDGLLRPREAFLPWVLLPNGQTVGGWIEPRISEAIESGEVPKLLPFTTTKR